MSLRFLGNNLNGLPTSEPCPSRQALLQIFRDASFCVQAYIQLSVTGSNGGGFMKNKALHFSANTQAWAQGKFDRPNPQGFTMDKDLLPQTNLIRLKKNFINPNEAKDRGDFNFESCTQQEIADYLNRCRIMRYGDCDVHSMEVAMLLIHIGVVDANHVHIVNDQKWEHTFVKITPHEKCPYTFVIDAWSDNIASNPLSLKKYQNPQKLSNGEPALKHEVLAENFLRNPKNIEHFGNSLIQEMYRRKVANASPSIKNSW